MSDKNIIILTNVRLRYEALFDARPTSDDKPDDLYYQATVVLDNDRDASQLDKADALTERIALDFFHKKVPLKHRPVRDGNEKSDVDGFGDGVSFIGCKRKSRPGVVDRELNPVSKEDGVFYPGCFVNISMRFFAYSHPTGGKGVSAELVSVQFVKDGERFSGGASTDPTLYFKSLGGGEGGGSSPSRARSRSGGKPSLEDF
jgi:hypothetical protein